MYAYDCDIVNTFDCLSGNMSIEELLKKYKSQKESTTPDTINDDDNKMEENSNNSSVMDEESDEPGLESLVSGKTVQEVINRERKSDYNSICLLLIQSCTVATVDPLYCGHCLDMSGVLISEVILAIFGTLLLLVL